MIDDAVKTVTSIRPDDPMSLHGLHHAAIGPEDRRSIDHVMYVAHVTHPWTDRCDGLTSFISSMELVGSFNSKISTFFAL